jgi:DNA helicase II / ATP-dependent DNA helicase PcrA
MYRVSAGDCPTCNNPYGIFISHSEKNPNRVYAKCIPCGEWGTWLDQPHTAYYATTAAPATPFQLEEKPKNAYESMMATQNESNFMAGFDLVPIEEGPQTVVPVPQPRREPNEEQAQAIYAPIGIPIRVEAGPGSGKTFVISYRYAYMLEQGVPGESIVACTYGKRMADDLLRRIMALSPNISNQAVDQICTIHALCNRAISSYYETSYQIPTGAKIKWILGDILKATFRKAEDRPAWEEVYKYINLAKANGHDGRTCRAFYAKGLDNTMARIMEDIHKSFDTGLAAEGYWTYADQILRMELALKEDHEFLAWCQNKYKHFILDEGQDTIHQAMRIFNILASLHHSIMIVGDTDQLLYRFAGATPEANLHEGWEDTYPDSFTVQLVTNYRSTVNIIQSARNVIQNNYSVGGGPYSSKYFKPMHAKPNAEEGDPIEVNTSMNVQEEARWLLDKVNELTLQGHQPGDIFVEVRTRAQTGYVESVLGRTEIPYINATGVSFWDVSHVRNVISYLRLMESPTDAEALANVYNIASNKMVVPWKNSEDYLQPCNTRFLGKEFLTACGGSIYTARKMLNPNHTAYKWKFTPGIKDLIGLMDDLQEFDTSNPADSIQAIMDLSYSNYLKLEAGLANTDLGEGGESDDIETVKEIAAQYSTRSEFLAYVKKMVDQAAAMKDQVWDGKLVLGTFHRFKGLERPIVFMLGCSEWDENVPKNPISSLLPHTFTLIDPPQDGILPSGKKGLIEDERDIFYVGMTRAQTKVFISSVMTYRKSYLVPSRFIFEMG